MGNEDKTKEQPVDETDKLCQCPVEMKLSETECREAEKALWKSEKKYLVIAKALSDTLCQCELERRFIYANEAAIYVFGYSMDELLYSIRVDEIVDEKDAIVLPCPPQTGPVIMLV